jgi:hypothetical protein
LVDDIVDSQFFGTDVQDLASSGLVGEGDFDMDFQTTRSEERFINHVLSVGHTNDEDVVQLVDTIHL